MDPGSKAFWLRHGRRTALAVTVICALLAFALLLGTMGSRAGPGDGVVRLTAAQLQDNEAWRDVPLPWMSDTRQSQVQTLRVPLDAAAAVRGPLHVFIPRWLAQGSLSVHADGRVLYRSEGSPGANLFFKPAVLLDLVAAGDTPAPSGLLLRLEAAPGQPAALSPVYLGPSAPLLRMAAARDWVDRQLPFAGSVAFMLVALFSLTVWLYRRRPQNMYIVAIAVCQTVRLWHFGADSGPLPVPEAWFAWLVPNALLWQVIALHFFLRLHHLQEQRVFNRVLPWAALAFSMLTLPGVQAFTQPHVFVNAVVVAVGVLNFWNAWRTRWLQGWVIAGVYLFLVLCGVWDWVSLHVLHQLEGHALSPYAGFVLFLTFTASMFIRYLTVLNEIEIVNAGLEQRLASREAELAESYERLSQVERRQTLSNERSRLMQDMHDGLGSSLTGAIRAVDNGGMTDAEVSQTLQDCMDDLKLAIDSMEPVEADLLLLLATLRFRLEPRIDNAGVALRWEVQDVPALPWLDPSSALHILRIVQESVANILRHTRATEIRVSTAAVEGGVEVAIEDNGQGFDVDKAHAQASGRGLRNQVRRAEAIHGRAGWRSGPAGTRFTLWLPLAKAPCP